MHISPLVVMVTIGKLQPISCIGRHAQKERGYNCCTDRINGGFLAAVIVLAGCVGWSFVVICKKETPNFIVDHARSSEQRYARRG